MAVTKNLPEAEGSEQMLQQGARSWRVKCTSLWAAGLFCITCKATKLLGMQVGVL